MNNSMASKQTYQAYTPTILFLCLHCITGQRSHLSYIKLY